MIVELTHTVLLPQDYARPPRPEHGCESGFNGFVRNINDGKQVQWVDYTAHETLALAIMREIAAEAEQRLGPGLSITLVHRLGRIMVGEISVHIMIGAAHRAAAFEACRYIIEAVKTRVPIWKKESYEDGNSQWLAGTVLAP